MKFNLFFKIYIPILILIIIILLLFGYINLIQQKKSYHDIMKAQLETIVKSNIKNNTEYILSDDKAQLISESLKILKDNSLIKYIIYDKKNDYKVIVKKDKFAIKSVLDQDCIDLINSKEKYFIKKIPVFSEELFHYVQRIKLANHDWGNFLIGISVDVYNKQYKELFNNFLIVTTLSILLATLIVYIFVKWITIPIVELKDSVNSVIKGERKKIKVNKIDDEIDQLKNDFNIMIDYLIHSEKQEEYLFQQSKMAQLGELLNNISHQWRQPLSVITVGLSGIKINRDLGLLTDEDFNNSYEAIMNNTNYLSETINTFSKYFQTDVLKENIELNEFFEDVVKLNNDLLNKNFVKIEIEFSETKINIFSYPSLLSYTFMNLILNSCEAFEKNEIKDRFIKISFKEKENNIELIFEDNAGGIDDNIIDKIFEPYFTTSHSSKGTGMGLYLTYDIVKKSLNGDIIPINTENGVKFIINIQKNL